MQKTAPSPFAPTLRDAPTSIRIHRRVVTVPTLRPRATRIVRCCADAVPVSRAGRIIFERGYALAEGEGFEPPVDLRLRQFSRLLQSTALPPTRSAIFLPRQLS